MSHPIKVDDRRLAFGVGFDDHNYQLVTIKNGVKHRCKYHQAWRDMLRRCYSNKTQDAHPTYKGCSVDKEWHTFSNFKLWMESQDWVNKFLDKDILNQGNKIYNPKNCIFVSRLVNNLFNTSNKTKGKLPTGVTKNKKSGNYIAQYSNKGKRIQIGTFKSVKEAFLVYKKVKYNYIKEVALTQQEPVKSALLNYIIKG